MSNILTARVASWQARGETLWEAVALFNDRPVHRVEERLTEQQARSELTDWAQRMGKRLAWEGQLNERPGQSKAGPNAKGNGETAASSSAVVLATGEKALSRHESELLFDCEKAIERGLKTFVEVGHALLTVRDKRLYRHRFATFEEYVRGRWGMSVRHAHRLCDAAGVVDNLAVQSSEPAVTVLPASESQARPLAKLPAAQQPEVWKEAVKSAPGAQVTARHVEETVRRHRGEPIKATEPANQPEAVVREFALEADPHTNDPVYGGAIQRLALKAKSACAELVGTIKPLRLRVSLWHAAQGLAHIENFLKEVNNAAANGRLFAKAKKPLAISAPRQPVASKQRISAAGRARLSAIARARWIKAKAAGVNSFSAKRKPKRANG